MDETPSPPAAPCPVCGSRDVAVEERAAGEAAVHRCRACEQIWAERAPSAPGDVPGTAGGPA